MEEDKEECRFLIDSETDILDKYWEMKVKIMKKYNFRKMQFSRDYPTREKFESSDWDMVHFFKIRKKMGWNGQHNQIVADIREDWMIIKDKNRPGEKGLNSLTTLIKLFREV